MTETSSSTTISTKLERIAKLAREAPEMAFTTLAHHIDIDWLKEAYRRTRKDGATGVDGQTAEEYAENLEGNLQVAARTREVRHVPGTACAAGPYPEGRRVADAAHRHSRPSKIRSCSARSRWCWRPSTSRTSWTARTASGQDARRIRRWRLLRHEPMCMAGGWVLEVDIRKFFDTLDHGHLREILRRRVRDGVLLRLIGKWLNAGCWRTGA